MTYTRSQLETALDNISGVMPSEVFEEALDSFNSGFEELDTKVITFSLTLGTDADFYVPVPFAGTVEEIYTAIDQSLTTGDETLVFKNGTDSLGTVTIAQSGSAAGDVDSLASPSNNSFSKGDAILVEVGGENGTAATAIVTVKLKLS